MTKSCLCILAAVNVGDATPPAELKSRAALASQIEADLIVMGNTAETILNQLECSVLVIKPPGFVTPVTLEG